MATAAPHRTAAVAPEKRESQSVRLDYLDGLRGLSAFGVVLFHACDTTGFPSFLRAAFAWTKYGCFAVAIFIVLSGYCLMLPVARSRDGALRGGVVGFMKRRARRILPPYYAAIGLALAMLGILWLAGADSDKWVQDAQPAFAAGPLVSHLFLVHTISPDWVYKVSGPLWSVATEWHIYFVFAILLLPIWRRWGTGAAVAVAFGLGLAPHFLLPKDHAFDWARPWYLGLFAIGMAAAAIGFARTGRLAELRERMPWGWISPLCIAVIFVWAAAVGNGSEPLWCKEVLVGAAAAALIICCTRWYTRGAEGQTPLALRILANRRVVALGAFSYSLYLTHTIWGWLITAILTELRLSAPMVSALRILVGIPAMVACAYLFHIAFERRFLPGHFQPNSR